MKIEIFKIEYFGQIKRAASKRGQKPLAPAVVEERLLAAESNKAQKLLAKEKKTARCFSS